MQLTEIDALAPGLWREVRSANGTAAADGSKVSREIIVEVARPNVEIFIFYNAAMTLRGRRARCVTYGALALAGGLELFIHAHTINTCMYNPKRFQESDCRKAQSILKCGRFDAQSYCTTRFNMRSVYRMIMPTDQRTYFLRDRTTLNVILNCRRSLESQRRQATSTTPFAINVAKVVDCWFRQTLLEYRPFMHAPKPKVRT